MHLGDKPLCLPAAPVRSTSVFRKSLIQSHFFFNKKILKLHEKTSNVFVGESGLVFVRHVSFVRRGATHLLNVTFLTMDANELQTDEKHLLAFFG